MLKVIAEPLRGSSDQWSSLLGKKLKCQTKLSVEDPHKIVPAYDAKTSTKLNVLKWLVDVHKTH